MPSIEKLKEEWSELTPNKKYAMIGAAVAGVVWIGSTYIRNTNKEAAKAAAAPVQIQQVQQQGGSTVPTLNPFIPQTNRNQGLEDLSLKIEEAGQKSRSNEDKVIALQSQLASMSALLTQMKVNQNAVTNPNNLSGAGNIANSLPPPVDFNAPGAAAPGAASATPNQAPLAPPSIEVAKGTMTEWKSTPRVDRASKNQAPPITIPALTGIEAIMLTGIDARTATNGNSTTGSVTSANNVGTPFVSRVKGAAIMPNGWRGDEIADCHLSGTGIGVLSTERANMTAERLSCVDTKGRIFEAKVKAYAVGLDGKQGVSGTLVHKVGAALGQTLLAGIASGLGQALTPQPIQSFNSNATGGQGSKTGYTTPSGELIAGTALGTGVSTATAQLAKFYLDYAKQIFPIIEVPAATRITWILQEGIELNAVTKDTKLESSGGGGSNNYLSNLAR